MQDDFKTRMMRRHPSASQRPSTLAVPDPRKPVVSTNAETGYDPSMRQQPAFDIPIDGEAITLDALVALSKNGDSVPMPVSRAMTDKEIAATHAGQTPSAHMTKLEWDTLTKLGWRNGEPIPPDFSSELKNTFTQYVAQKQAEGIPLDQIKIGRIEDLPESEQNRLRGVMREMIDSQKASPASGQPTTYGIQQLDGYPDPIRQVLAGVDLTPSIPTQPSPRSNGEPLSAYSDPVKQVLMEERKPIEPPKQTAVLPPALSAMESESPKREISVFTCNTCGRDPYREKQRFVCSHCGQNPLEDPDTKEINLDDKRRFLVALGSKKPFEKEYTFFGDTIKVRFRTLRNREFDELPVWAIKKAAGEKLLVPQDMLKRVEYLELLGTVVLQTKLLQSTITDGNLFWSAPDVPYPTFDDWGVGSMDELVEHFMEEIPSEAVIVALQQQVTRFNELDVRMSREAKNTTNFWAET